MLTYSRIVALILVFSVGSVAVIASIVRLNALLAFTKSKDISCEFGPHAALPDSTAPPVNVYARRLGIHTTMVRGQPNPSRVDLEIPPS